MGHCHSGSLHRTGLPTLVYKFTACGPQSTFGHRSREYIPTGTGITANCFDKRSGASPARSHRSLREANTASCSSTTTKSPAGDGENMGIAEDYTRTKIPSLTITRTS